MSRGRYERLQQAWLASTNGLSVLVLLANFLISFMESFPTTAFTSVLNDDLHMSLPMISTFYAVEYFPWMWKPLYGWISDNLPIGGYHRKPYIGVGAIGSGLCYVITAVWVSAAWQIFLVRFSCNVFSACLQLMVGAFLVDVARSNTKNSVALQGVANAAGWLGSGTSQIMALAVYAHPGLGEKSSHGVSARAAIALTAVAPAVLVVLTPFFPEVRAASRGACACSPRGVGAKEGRLAATVAIMQLNLLLVGCQTLMRFEVWWRAVAACAAVSSCTLACIHFLPTRSGCRTLPSTAAGMAGSGVWVRLCLFCFFVPAFPTSSVALGQLQYAALAPESYQALGIMADWVSFFACFVFARSFHRWPMKHVLVASTAVAAVAALAPLPFALAGSVVDAKQELWSWVGALAIVATLAGAVSSIFSVVSVDSLVTLVCGNVGLEKSSTAYAVLLSFQGFGNTVGGLVASRALAAMGIGAHDWSGIGHWVIITALLKLFTLPLVLLLPGFDAGPCDDSAEPLAQDASPLEQAIAMGEAAA